MYNDISRSSTPGEKEKIATSFIRGNFHILFCYYFQGKSQKRLQRYDLKHDDNFLAQVPKSNFYKVSNLTCIEYVIPMNLALLSTYFYFTG